MELCLLDWHNVWWLPLPSLGGVCRLDVVHCLHWLRSWICDLQIRQSWRNCRRGEQTLFCTLLYTLYTIPYTLYYTILYCTVLHCTALQCTALHCTALHCTALHCTVLYYIILYFILYTLYTLHTNALADVLSPSSVGLVEVRGVWPKWTTKAQNFHVWFQSPRFSASTLFYIRIRRPCPE